MGFVVPKIDPYLLLVNDPALNHGGVHWNGTSGAHFGPNDYYCIDYTFVEIFPAAVTIKVAVAGDFRFSTIITKCNHSRYRHTAAGWASGWSSKLGFVPFTKFLNPGSYTYRVQFQATSGVVDVRGNWIAVEGDNGGDVQAYQASVEENFVPPDKSKYEYWPGDPYDISLLANHDWPANILIQRDRY